jgi:ribonuclease VapC
MIIDSSALLAILKGEPEAEAMAQAMETADSLRLSTGSYLEAFAVLDAYRNPRLSARLEEIVEHPRMTVEAFTAEQAKIARQAYREYGRGSGHPARLNFGDCMTYALARIKREPVLFKGEDFTHTDLRPAIEL